MLDLPDDDLEPYAGSPSGTDVAPTKPCSIYILVDPRTEEVRYVGKAANPGARLSGHVTQAKRRDTYCRRWIAQLVDGGLRPKMIIVEGPTLEWEEAERRWIAHYRAQNARLTNLTDGGEGLTGYHHTDETKRKIAEGNRGISHGMEHRLDHLAEMTRRWQAKPAEERKRGPLSDERRRQISAQFAGVPKSADHRRAIGDASRGRPVSIATRDKISRSKTGTVPHNKGVPMSDEQKRKISDTKREAARRKREEKP